MKQQVYVTRIDLKRPAKQARDYSSKLHHAASFRGNPANFLALALVSPLLKTNMLSCVKAQHSKCLATHILKCASAAPQQ